MGLDLTPFGFTQTESAVYGALLALGPASGYAVAREAGIARANAYQALSGLVTKDAAVLVAEDPKRFRAVQPRALLARIAAAEARALDALERSIDALDAEGAASLVSLDGLRAIQDVAMRMLVRDPGPLTCLAPADVLSGLTPALRKRRADGGPLEVWIAGDGAVSLPENPAGRVPPSSLDEQFGGPAVLLAGPGAAIAARLGDAPSGYWTSEPLLTAIIATALTQLTG